MFANGHVHVYSPGARADNSKGTIHSIVSFAASFPPLNDFVTVFTIQTYIGDLI